MSLYAGKYKYIYHKNKKDQRCLLISETKASCKWYENENHYVVELFQMRDCQEAAHGHAVFN